MMFLCKKIIKGFKRKIFNYNIYLIVNIYICIGIRNNDSSV